MSKGNRTFITLFAPSGNAGVYHSTRSKATKAGEIERRKYNPKTRTHEVFKAKDTSKGSAGLARNKK